MDFKTADLCDEYSDILQIAQPGMLSFGGRIRFAGPVVTIKLFEDNSLLRDMLDNAGEGKVIVVDGGGSMRCALLGDMLAGKAVANDWAGLVINGCIRDSVDIAKMDIGIRAFGTHPLKSVKRGVGEIDVPVSFANIEFVPGHFLYADEDGIILAQRDLLTT